MDNTNVKLGLQKLDVCFETKYDPVVRKTDVDVIYIIHGYMDCIIATINGKVGAYYYNGSSEIWKPIYDDYHKNLTTSKKLKYINEFLSNDADADLDETLEALNIFKQLAA